MNAKTWIAFAAVAVLLLGGLVFFSSQNRVNVDDVDTNVVLSASEDSGNIADHTIGNTESKVVFIEYGDYQCPGCASANPRVKELVEKYQDHLVFVYRHLPLTSIHPHARAAATAAEAAGLQGKYWEMHHKLFDNQNAWSSASAAERTDIFRSYAREIDLDLDRFDTDLQSGDITKKINFNLALAKKINATSTPTFVLNGETVSQDIWGDDEALENELRAKIIEAGITLPEDEE